jgi:hypothetical protein
LLENKVLNASRLQSIASSFDSSFDPGVTVEDEEKKRVAELIHDLYREKLVSVLSDLEGFDPSEFIKRIDQWSLPTPNSSLNIETDLRSNKSPTSSRTDSFVIYPEGIVSFRNLTPSPDACMSPTFLQSATRPALVTSISFESIEPL